MALADIEHVAQRNFSPARSTSAEGYREAVADSGEAPPLYHTTGEVLDVISAPGLERIARFLASFVSSVDRAPRGQINP